MIGYFNLVNNLNNYVNYYFIIIIVPAKPLWGGSIKYVCMYVHLLHRNCPLFILEGGLVAGMTAFPVQGQMASFSTRKKIERNNMSLLDHNLQIRVVGKTHQSPPPGLSCYPCAPSFLLTLK